MVEVTSFANWDNLDREAVREGIERVGFRGEDTLLVIHWGEVIGDEPAMNLDVFNPIREDYKHLVEHQAADFGEG